MKTLCVLAVVVVAVGAWPGCSSYCDQLFSGTTIEWRSDCNCVALQKQRQDGDKYEHDLKSILLPVKSQTRQPTFKDIHKNQENDRISPTSNIFSGFVNSKPSEVTHNKIKRNSHDEDTLEEKDQNSSITSKSSDDVLVNIPINEKNLSDCIGLLILINIRKNKNKNITNLESIALKKKEHLNEFEINTEIKGKCYQATAIVRQSIAEIKEHQKYISRRKNHNVNVTPKIDVRSEVTDETTPVTYTNEDFSTISTVQSTTPDDELYTNKVTTTDSGPIVDSTINYFISPTTLEDNIRNETTDNYSNLKNVNYSIPVIMKDDNTTNTTDDSSINSIANTTSPIQTITGNNSDLFYKVNELQELNLTYEFTSEKSLDPLINNLNENNTSRRDGYNENEVPIISIITREYSNDTISSDINGIEILNNTDFEEETIIHNNKTENTSDTTTIAPESEIQLRSDDATPSSSEKQTFVNTPPIISGRLYFEYGQEHIPVHFVQTPDGHLRLSLDLNSICNDLIQKGKQNSLLITTLCEYLY